jgi:hypothetical protein
MLKNAISKDTYNLYPVIRWGREIDNPTEKSFQSK